MIRIPDRAYRMLVRVCFAQKRIRDAELHREVARQDQLVRWYYKLARVSHGSGVCGGAGAGCCYYPCVPRVVPS